MFRTDGSAASLASAEWRVDSAVIRSFSISVQWSITDIACWIASCPEPSPGAQL